MLSENDEAEAVSDEELAAELAEEENERWSSGEYIEESNNDATSESASEENKENSSENKPSDDLDDLLNNRIYTDDNK